MDGRTLAECYIERDGTVYVKGRESAVTKWNGFQTTLQSNTFFFLSFCFPCFERTKKRVVFLCN